MRTLFLLLTWVMVCLAWKLSKHLSSHHMKLVEHHLSDAEVALKVDIEDLLNATVKKWSEA